MNLHPAATLLIINSFVTNVNVWIVFELCIYVNTNIRPEVIIEDLHLLYLAVLYSPNPVF